MPGTTSTALSSFSHAWPAPQNRCGQTERRNQCYKELDLLVYLLIYSGAKIFVVNITRWSNLKEKGEQKNVSVQLFSCSPTHFHPTKCIRMASKFRNFKQKVSGTRYFDVQLADALARRRPTRQNILSRQAIHLRLRRLVRQMGRF